VEIFPTAYFGNVAYFKSLIAAVDPFIEAHEHFIKQSLRSRCEILGANGPQTLSIPVIRKNGSKTPVHEVLLDDHKRWRKEHWRSIESAYASSPYFEFYDKEVRMMIEFDTDRLIDLNMNITRSILDLLEINNEFGITEAYQMSDITTDYRPFDFNLPDQKRYIQVFGDDFVPNLSVLDLLFCEGPMARNILLEKDH
jgi:hypothetical protein